MVEFLSDLSTRDIKAQKVEGLAREVLGKTYVTFQTKQFFLDEDFDGGHAKVRANLRQHTGEQTTDMDIEGQGVGLVDALFDGMLKSFAREYSSLSSIAIVDFNIHIKVKSSYGRRSDAMAIAMLTIRNSEDNEYAFSHSTPSVSQSSVAVVQDAVKFFVNSERAYIQLYVALEDAKKRGRFDLVERYQNQMSTLVQATSYRKIVEQMTADKK